MHHPFDVHRAGRFLIMSRDGVVEPNLVWKDTVLYGPGNRRHPAGHWIIPNQDHSVLSRDTSPVGRRAGRSSVAASPASEGELALRTPCSSAFKPVSLNRHVTAPAAIASLTRRRSVLAVRITTRTAGSRDTICRVASTRLLPACSGPSRSPLASLSSLGQWLADRLRRSRRHRNLPPRAAPRPRRCGAVHGHRQQGGELPRGPRLPRARPRW